MGHGGDAAVGSTSRPSFLVRGRVDPPESSVTIEHRQTRRRHRAVVSRSGRFSARVTHLRRGANAFVLEGRRRGYRPWTMDLRIVRR